MRIEWVGEPERFEQLEADWEGMLPAGARPFDTHPWYRSWYRAFGAEGDMRICLAWEGDRLVGALPLMERRRRWLSAMANIHSPVYRPVGSSPEAVRAVVEAGMARSVAKISLSALPSHDPALAMLGETATAGGRRYVVDPEHVSPLVEMGEGIDGLARRVEAALGRAARALPAQDGPRPRGRALDRRAARGPGDRAGPRIRRRGQRLEGRERHGHPLRTPGPRSSTARWPRASPSAASCGCRGSCSTATGRRSISACSTRGRLYLLKTGYDERFRRLAPGLVMRLSTIERCFELGLEAHELLGDDTEWKRKFDTGERRHVGFHAYEPGVVGSFSYAYRARARPLLKRAYEGAQARRRS